MKEKNNSPNLIVHSKQVFTSLEKDIFSIVVNKLDSDIDVNTDLFINKVIEIKANELNVPASGYNRLKKASYLLFKKEIIIDPIDTNDFDFIHPFERINYKKGTLYVFMSARVLPFFLELKNGYTEYYLKEILSLKGFKQKRMYELLSSRKKLPRSDWKVYDGQLKEMLNITAKHYDKRPARIDDLYVFPTIEAINELTSLDVIYTRDKDADGWFCIFKTKQLSKEPIFNEDKTIKINLDTERAKTAYEQLRNWGIIDRLILKTIIETRLEDYFSWKYHKNDDLRKGKIQSPAGALLSHLKLVKKSYKKATKI